MTFLPDEVSSDCDNTTFFFHSEPTFSANDDEHTMWKDSTEQDSKGRGAGLMVSQEQDGSSR